MGTLVNHPPQNHPTFNTCMDGNINSSWTHITHTTNDQYSSLSCKCNRNATLHITFEAAAVWLRQCVKGLYWSGHLCVGLSETLIWPYVWPATYDVAHCAPQMTRSIHRATAVHYTSLDNPSSECCTTSSGSGLLYCFNYHTILCVWMYASAV